MPRRWFALGVPASILAIGFGIAGAWAAPRVAPRDAASGCASLGQAEQFVAFSHDKFNASPAGGETLTGRIAAAGNVTLGGGVYVRPASGDTSPAVIAGGDFTAGQSGTGGEVQGSVLYAGSAHVAANFVIHGGSQHGDPPFNFDDEFESLALLSASWADLGQSPGATVALNPYSHALELTGTEDGLNVFTVDGDQLAQAAGVVVTLTQPGATALINVTTDTDLAMSFQYENLSGTADAAHVAWNFPLATTLAITGSVSWQGMLLAPNATVMEAANGQFNGQLIAKTIPAADRTMNLVAFAGCLPPPEPVEPPSPPDDTLKLKALCVNAAGDLTMRMRNSGDVGRNGTWLDNGGSDSGTFDVPAHSDEFFDVQDPSSGGVIEATADTTTVSAPTISRRCQGRITVHLVTRGPAPAGASWNVRLSDGAGVSSTLALGAGDSETVRVPGGYVSGVAPIDQVVGGIAYVVSLEDTHGGDATISLNPVEILDRQHELVVVTITFEEETVTPPTRPLPEGPDQPTLPPGAPVPPIAPDLEGGVHGTDLAIAHSITPRRVLVGGTITTLTRVRNRSHVSADNVVAREIPQYRPAHANSVARVLSLTTTRGHCTHRRPVRCELGTLAPGAVATIRTRTRLLVPGFLRSVVTVSSRTPETNTANNMAIAAVTAVAPKVVLHARVSAPRVTRVGTRIAYHVSVTAGGTAGATSVRLCTRVPTNLFRIRSSGTIRYRGMLCRNLSHLGRGHSIGFTTSGVASAHGHLFPSAHATALGATSHAVTHILVLGPLVACPSRAGGDGLPAASTEQPPTARAAC